MATSRFFGRILIAAAVVAIGAVAIVAAQSASNATDPLLEEVRALRADVNRAATTSIRAQLLLTRLQSQEQRINALSGQLTDLRRQLTTQRSGRADMASQLTECQQTLAAPAVANNDHLAALQNECRALARTLRQADQEQQQLEAQETEVVNQLTAEQSRWIDFNSRLDEIERQLTVR
jgi:predicted RNase H-like nuclease (RuvC/YqgF family)